MKKIKGRKRRNVVEIISIKIYFYKNLSKERTYVKSAFFGICMHLIENIFNFILIGRY